MNVNGYTKASQMAVTPGGGGESSQRVTEGRGGGESDMGQNRAP